MTPIDFGAWLGGSRSPVPAQAPFRAQVQRARILDKPVSISLKRNEVDLPAQEFRVELYNTAVTSEGTSGISALRDAVVFGIQHHPTLPDSDIQAWDTFVLDNKEYTVLTVNRENYGQVQAYCELVG